MEKKLQIKCPAKVNLSLDVLNKRPDNYHNLKMIMHTVKLYDILTVSFKKADETNILIMGKNKFVPSDERNLCAKAAKLFLDYTGIKAEVKLQLKKHIPVSAGLGGGSSDAAGTLVALNQLSGANLDKKTLCALAKNIGADVPFFIYGGCSLAEGIGDVLSPLPSLKDVFFLIAKPSFGVSTPMVYKNLILDDATFHPDIDAASKAVTEGDLASLARLSGNVLESVVIPLYPKIQQYKDIIKKHGALYSLMSGSGASVFGVFDREDLAEAAKQELEKHTDMVYIA